MQIKCNRCRKGCDGTLAPMLQDEVWLKLANEQDRLCFSCMLDRSIERRVDIPITALLPCGFNLFHSPHSYFDLWMSDEKELPSNVDEWREANKQVWPRNELLEGGQ